MIIHDLKPIYIVPSWHCNLCCPHCFVSKQTEEYNSNKFLDALRSLKEKYPDAHFVLHGGEPTLYQDRYYSIMNTGIINSICTNLIIKDEILTDINARDIIIATSWNPNRFTKSLETMWLDNISKLKNKPLILITLDQDLLKYDISKFIKLLKIWENLGIREILFEPLVNNDLDDTFQNEADEWLCSMHHIWKENGIKMNNLIEEQILDWNFRCNALTLYPNGEVKRGCILGTECNKILDKCLNCKFASVCQPCVLHSRCSFYPKFYELIKNA